MNTASPSSPGFSVTCIGGCRLLRPMDLRHVALSDSRRFRVGQKEQIARRTLLRAVSNDDGNESSHVEMAPPPPPPPRVYRRRFQRTAYLLAAVASSAGVTFVAGGAVYYRFAWQFQGEHLSLVEMLGTFTLAVGAAVGMEFWARWAHRALWHACLWKMHESHHRAREGPFELNDVFALVNAVPAVALLAYGSHGKGLLPSLCFGAGLGITLFGIAYMFVHDGLVHRRFPVGPIADVPYLRKVATAHQLHHSHKFNGVPYGLFLGPKELEDVGGSDKT